MVRRLWRSFSNRLFLTSIFCWVEALYQFNGVLGYTLYYLPVNCNRTYKNPRDVIASVQYYGIRVCVNRTVSDVFRDTGSRHVDNTTRMFFKMWDSLPLRSNEDVTLAITVICMALNLMWCLTSSMMFSSSFCARQLGKNACKYVIIPWMVITALVVVYDILMTTFFGWLVYNCQKSVVSWINIHGYDEFADRFKIFDDHPSPLLIYALNRFTKYMLVFSFRHVITVPVCIFCLISFRRDVRRILKGDRLI